MSENNKLLLLAVEEYKKQNYSVAVPMFAELADKQNDPKAQAFLAYCYFQGLGIEKSFEKAVEYYQKSADQGNESAERNLAVFYEFGQGVRRDIYKAIKIYSKYIDFYRESAKAGDSFGCNALGLCYSTGTGVPVDHKRAFEYFSVAAKQGHLTSINSLGRCYSLGEGAEHQNALLHRGTAVVNSRENMCMEVYG